MQRELHAVQSTVPVVRSLTCVGPSPRGETFDIGPKTCQNIGGDKEVS